MRLKCDQTNPKQGRQLTHLCVFAMCNNREPMPWGLLKERGRELRWRGREAQGQQVESKGRIGRELRWRGKRETSKR